MSDTSAATDSGDQSAVADQIKGLEDRIAKQDEEIAALKRTEGSESSEDMSRLGELTDPGLIRSYIEANQNGTLAKWEKAHPDAFKAGEGEGGGAE